MDAVPRPSDAADAELLQRLAHSRGFAEACSQLFGRADGAGALPTALVLVWLPTGVRAQGHGLPIANVRTFGAAAADPETVLGPGWHDDHRTSPRWQAAELPFFGVPDARARRFDAGAASVAAAMVVPGDAIEEAGVQALARLLDECGALLGWIAETDAAVPSDVAAGSRLEMVSAILDSLPDPVLLTDENGAILLSNSRAEYLLGAHADDSGGRRRAIEINNLLFGSFLAQGGSVAGGSPRELNLVDPGDGSDLLFEILTVPLHGGGGEGGTQISILRDITDLKRAVSELEEQINRSIGAEHRARRERDQLNVVLENVTDPILVTDEKSNIILVNREGERLFVVSPEREEESAHRRVVRTNDTTFSTLISDFVLQPARRRVEKLELTDPDTGDRFPAEVVSSKILNQRGEPTAIVSVIHDLTQVVENERLASELKQLNEELEQRIEHATEQLAEHNRQLQWQRQELEKASRLKSEFLANMSHELRTPINVVLGYTSLMRERIYGELTEQQEEGLERIYTTSQHLLELINDILDLSKIEAGKMPVHLEWLELPELIRELSEQVRPLLERRSLEYAIEVEPKLPSVRTDRTKVKQILLNLLSNAIKFTHHGSVTVRAVTVADETRVRLSVVDTGIGIQPTQLKTIFEDFRQVDQSPTREYGGTGLGLSITKKLLSLLGGTISVESRVGAGSTFAIELPIEAEVGSVDDQVHRALLDSEGTVVDADESGDGSVVRRIEKTREAVSRAVRKLGGK